MRRTGIWSAFGLVAGALLVWLDWHPGSQNPAMPTQRLVSVIIGLMLVALPWLVRPVLGPVADNRTARTVRAAGYVSLYALLLVMAGLSRFASSRFDHFEAFDQENWESDMRSGAIVSATIVIALLGGYALTILALTARRVSVSGRVLVVGVGGGVVAGLMLYGVAPLGNLMHPEGWLRGAYQLAVLLPLVVPLLAGMLVRRTATGSPPVAWPRTTVTRGGITGLCVGGTAALLVSVLAIATMLLWPRHVELRWANPDPNVEHGTPYELRMSVGDAAIKYEIGLLALPLLGFVLGTIGGVGLDGEVTPPKPVGRREEVDATAV